MQKKIRKIVSSILASCMVISAFAGIAPQKAEAKTTLVNVAVNGTVSTQNGENGSYVIDNSIEYHKRANFPENIEFSGISLYSDKSIRHHKNTRNFNGN